MMVPVIMISAFFDMIILFSWVLWFLPVSGFGIVDLICFCILDLIILFSWVLWLLSFSAFGLFD